MDEATLELRRKIDEMLLASSTPQPNHSAAASGPFARTEEPDADGGHGLLGAFRMEDFAVRSSKPKPIIDEREEI